MLRFMFCTLLYDFPVKYMCIYNYVYIYIYRYIYIYIDIDIDIDIDIVMCIVCIGYKHISI